MSKNGPALHRDFLLSQIVVAFLEAKGSQRAELIDARKNRGMGLHKGSCELILLAGWRRGSVVRVFWQQQQGMHVQEQHS
jgi:hypothetical protein